MDIHFFTNKQKIEILLDGDLQKELNLDDVFMSDLKDYISSDISLPQIENFVALNNAQIVFKAMLDLDEAMSLFFSGDSMEDLEKAMGKVNEDLYLAMNKFQKQMLCKK